MTGSGRAVDRDGRADHGDHGDRAGSDRRDGVAGPRTITALVAAGQALAVALSIALGSIDGGAPDAGAYVFAAGFGAVLLLRRRYAVPVLLVSVAGVVGYYALGYPAIGMTLPVVAALYSAAERGRIAVGVVAALALLVVSFVFRVTHGESAVALTTDFVANVALAAAAIALAVAVRDRRAVRRQQAALLAAERAREQERAGRRLDAQRVRLARDLHDSLGHALSLVSVQAKVARQTVGRDEAAAAAALDHVVTAADGSLADLRRTLGVLRADDAGGPVQDPVGVDGIEATAAAARRAGLTVDVELDPGARAVPAEVGATAYRIVQEALTNTLRHARAQHVRVRVHATPDGLGVEVVDDGTGRPDRAADGGVTEGRGLTGMRERAGLLGGTVTAGREATGFAVRARLPWGEAG